MKKIYCEGCKHYKGEVRHRRDFPMRPSKGWDYWCGLHNESVFRVNGNNDCTYFGPKESFLKKILKKFKHG